MRQRSNLWYERYANESPLPDEHIHLRPLHGTPQDPEDPVDEILRLYSDMWTSTTHGTCRTTPMLHYGKTQSTNKTTNNPMK